MTGEAEYALVMPFVVCASQGGPYDDASFVAGYDLGILDTLLDARPAVLRRTIRTDSVSQVDLIAMKHQYAARSTEEPEHPEWTTIELTRLLA